MAHKNGKTMSCHIIIKTDDNKRQKSYVSTLFILNVDLTTEYGSYTQREVRQSIF